MFHVRKILYATDFSSWSNQAYFHAVALAAAHGSTLTIVYVYSPDRDPLPRHVRGDERAYWRSQLEQIRPTDRTIPVEHVFLEGDPATEIVRFALDAHIDMVVMGTHGRTGVERLLMGSVAEQVLRASPCSVLVVKMPKAVPAGERSDLELSAAY